MKKVMEEKKHLNNWQHMFQGGPGQTTHLVRWPRSVAKRRTVQKGHLAGGPELLKGGENQSKKVVHLLLIFPSRVFEQLELSARECSPRWSGCLLSGWWLPSFFDGPSSKGCRGPSDYAPVKGSWHQAWWGCRKLLLIAWRIVSLEGTSAHASLRKAQTFII